MILICDDDAVIVQSLRMVLERHGWMSESVAPAHLVDRLGEDVEAVLLDVYLGGVNGLELLKAIQERDPTVPVILISGQSGLAEAFAAVRLGARDFLEKPLSPERLVVSLRNALQDRVLARQVRERCFPVARSAALVRALDRLARAALTDSPLLILGESGTGKDRAADYVHALSPRASRPLVKLNCGALPESLLESELFGHVKGAFTGAVADYEGKLATAQGGTLFLDEVGDLPLSAQTRLLRFLETGEIQRLGTTRTQRCEARVISATHRDLERMAQEGSFRSDLLYRLGVLPVSLPPLRERREDILALVEYFFSQRGKPQSIEEILEPSARDLLLEYPWPGNVRELRSFCERLAIWASRLPASARECREHLRPEGGVTEEDPFGLTLPYKEAKRRLERRYLETQVRIHGSVKAAAEALGMLPNNLSRRLQQLSRGRLGREEATPP